MRSRRSRYARAHAFCNDIMWKIRRLNRDARANQSYCEHCDENLTRSQYFKHKKKYYNDKDGTWQRKGSISVDRFPVPDPFDQSSSDEEPALVAGTHAGDGAADEDDCPTKVSFDIYFLSMYNFF